uniref:Uncharacterized protein n=1 Tax=Coturnix japonica TaxID=93934 RepID=A0A8C2YBM0_COTJA
VTSQMGHHHLLHSNPQQWRSSFPQCLFPLYLSNIHIETCLLSGQWIVTGNVLNAHLRI